MRGLLGVFPHLRLLTPSLPCTPSPRHTYSFTPDKGRFRKYNTIMNQTLKNVALSLVVILLVAFLCLTGYIIAAGIWAFFLNA